MRVPQQVDKEVGFLDQTLRPHRWDEYIVAEKHQREPPHPFFLLQKSAIILPSTSFYGPPGLGKTTSRLSPLLKRLVPPYKSLPGRPSPRSVILHPSSPTFSPGDILFIDEIDRLNKAIEEVLYPAMESGTLDIIIAKGPSARTIQLGGSAAVSH